MRTVATPRALCFRSTRPLIRRLTIAASSGTATAAPPRPRPPWHHLRASWKEWWSLGGPSVAPQEPLGRTLKQLSALVKEDSALLTGAITSMLLAAGAELTIPHFVTAAVFAAAQEGSSPAFVQSLTRLTIATAVFAVAAGLRGYLFSLVNMNLLQRLRSRAFRSMMLQPVAWFDGADGGQLTSRLGSDCASVSRMVATSVNRAYQDTLADATARAEESFLLSRVVRTFGAEDAACARYDETLGRLAHISSRQAVAYSSFVVANHWGYNAMRAAALLVGGSAALRGQISAQQLTSFMLYVELFASATLSVADQYGPIMESLGASERVMAYLGKPPAPELAPGKVLDTVTGEIEFRNVSFSYPSRPNVLALDRVSLIIPAGRTVAFVGLSGSGKTTLVALLQRLYDPSVGTVKLDGHDVRTLDSTWFRSQLGVVSQDPRLFSLTVAENIAYGTPGTTRAQVERAAELANARGFIERLPEGFDTPVTDRLLSGGQRQRIAIARALIRDPPVLILDEATSALDAESEAAVHAALDRAMRQAGRTVLVIAHRLSTVRNAHLTVVMSAGRVAERGTHAELVRRGGLYATLVARQSGKLHPAPS
ncbi:ABC transporter B family member 26, chloroplastic [Auxenochlorella protothecoides]|uniref:ABC transporter B family member 26, chloroplastic n=1 Tax=Auxenochlorella protothecoides TaxID=3075 RepID=A0A087SLG9_AUXPR|nr:ABC transporter B family member 26, chloroplastic [Auxenochlorella protothecoides]KFM26573.1 ABC transporter B family member 26, chloroplastic [Auxenochlorella protothecoides]